MNWDVFGRLLLSLGMCLDDCWSEDSSGLDVLLDLWVLMVAVDGCWLYLDCRWLTVFDGIS